MAKKIGDSTLREFALVGARAKYAALQAELASLVATFPELAKARGTKGAAVVPGRKRGRKKPMTAAERKAVSERMRKYWAERKDKKR